MTYLITMHEHFATNRSAEEAFDYIIDFSRIAEWDQTILSARKVSSGPIGVNTEFDLLYSSGLRKLPIAYTVSEYEPSHRAVLIGKSSSFTAIDTVTIKPTQVGCEVTWHAEVTFQGLAAKIIPKIEKKVAAAGSQTIRNLENALRDDFEPPKLSVRQQLADKLIFPGVLGFSNIRYAKSARNWRPVTASIKNKHVVVTGATSGLGLATARELAHRGARLTLVARDKNKAELTKREIVEQTGNQKISVEIADLSIMKQVNSVAKRLLEKGDAIDVLINNAGLLLNERTETGEGLETNFALLLLAPVLLTQNCLPLLKLAKNGARVVNVSSGGMYGVKINLKNLESTRGQYRGPDAYARCKRALVIMGERWAERWATDNITVHNMHPGWAATPGVAKSLPTFNKVTRRILRTPAQGADTIIWLAHATEVAKTSGLFWLDRVPHATHLLKKTQESPAQRDSLDTALQEYLTRFGS